MDGKIDLIITKAVSRFARNLMDCIVWVEALQNHDPPVRVYFEQENLDTIPRNVIPYDLFPGTSYPCRSFSRNQ